MDDDELRELQDPSNWDFEHPEAGQPAEDLGGVVAVRFSAADFVRVARRAAEADATVTDFVRDVALEKAARQPVG